MRSRILENFESNVNKLAIGDWRLAIILPAWNEELTVAKTIHDFHNVAPHASIFVIDNNSSDRTASIAEETLLTLRCDGRVLSEPRQGKGNAIRRAFMSVDADVYVIADADTTYPAEQIGILISPIRSGHADMVVGDRHSDGDYAKQNERPFHDFGNRLVRYLVNKLFHANLSDIMSGFRAFNRSFVKNYPIMVEGFAIETDMTLHALDKRFRIVEIPVTYKPRPVGSFSKLSTYSDGARVIFTIAQMLRYYRPLMFFGCLALIMMFGGIIACLPVFHDWITHRYIYHVPLAILATGMEVVAAMMLSVGLILDSVAHHQRKNYELNLLAGSNTQ